MQTWMMLVAIGLITYSIRLSFILMMEKIKLPERFMRGLRFVPPAVLTAIIFPEVLMREGAIHFSPANPRLVAALVSVLVAWRTKNVLLTIAAGMLVLLSLQAII